LSNRFAFLASQFTVALQAGNHYGRVVWSKQLYATGEAVIYAASEI